MNLIPEKAVPRGSYYCTWHHQSKVMRKYSVPDVNGWGCRDALCLKYLFNEADDYHWLPMEDRAGLYLVLDDGWDVAPSSKDVGPDKFRFFGRVEPDPDKFAGLGDTPLERLTALNRLAMEHGYAGLGLWISPRVCGEDEKTTPEEAEEYWNGRARLCAEAGIRYWKVDWGRHSVDPEYRRMMTRAVKRRAPELMIEHAFVQKPITMPEDRETRREISRAVFALGDAFRSYDVMWPMAECVTLSRLHEVFQDAPAPEYGVRQLPNAEYRYFIAAGLGCALGVMDETVYAMAALRWERLAPPFGAGEAEYMCSDEFLTDSFYYPKDPVSWLKYAGKLLSESAPAVMARGCKLPFVSATGEIKPFVCASRNPITGVYAVSTIRRTVDPNALILAPARIAWEIEEPSAPVGVFGYMDGLTLVYPREIAKGARVWAQNLLDREAKDITEEVTVEGGRVTIPGRTLNRVGAFNHEYPWLTPERKIDDPMLVIKIDE